jgi:hypothetical protein
MHSQYNAQSLSNSMAILRVSPNVPIGLTPTIAPACLSSKNLRLKYTLGGAKRKLFLAPLLHILDHLAFSYQIQSKAFLWIGVIEKFKIESIIFEPLCRGYYNHEF